MSNIFKYGAEDLERLLPVSKFDKLESAMNAVVNAVSSADRDEIKCGLGRAMTPQLESPIDILRNIRRWALEGLRDEPLVSYLTHLQSPELLVNAPKRVALSLPSRHDWFLRMRFSETAPTPWRNTRTNKVV